MFSLEKKQLLIHLTSSLPVYTRKWLRIFTAVHGGRMIDNGHKLRQDMFRVNIRKNISLYQTEKQLSRETEQFPSLELFKT